MGGVQNGVGHVPVHVHHDESLVQDKGLSQQTGIKSGSGELEGHDINVSDGTVRQEVLSGGQESRGSSPRCGTRARTCSGPPTTS